MTTAGGRHDRTREPQRRADRRRRHRRLRRRPRRPRRSARATPTTTPPAGSGTPRSTAIPGLIVRCRGTADVVARSTSPAPTTSLVAVRGGGHNVAGRALCDDGLVIDLSEMRAVIVDPAAADRAGPGRRDPRRPRPRDPRCTGSRCRRASSRATGIAGLTLGGGVGWLVRKYGLTCDNVLAMRAGHRRRRPSSPPAPSEHPDLFWALQGRRRQLRRRDRLHLPRAPGLDRPRRPAGLAARPGRRRSCASTATSWRARRRS